MAEKRKRIRMFVANKPLQQVLNTELAAEIGINNSLVVSQLEFLLGYTTFWRDGQPWIKYSLEELYRVHFPYFGGKETLRRTINNLRDELGLVLVRNYNTDSKDRTQWYSLNIEGMKRLKSVTVTHNESWEPPQTGDVHTEDQQLPSTQDESPQVDGDISVPESANPTAVDGDDPAPITQNGSRPKMGTQKRDLQNPEARDASQQNGFSIEEQDLPNPEDLLPPEGATSAPAAPSTRDILQAVLEAGRPYPKSFKGHLATQINTLLRQKIPADVVLEAARRCVNGAKPHPNLMPALVVEVQNDRGGGRSNGNGHHVPFDASTQDYADTVVR